MQKKHPYHIVSPSPWPFVSSLAVLCLGIGAPLLFHGFTYQDISLGYGPLAIGGFLLLYSFYGWWRDVINESNIPGLHGPEVRQGFKFGMVLFIASELMFFVSFFWAYFHSGIFPNEATGFQWPPVGIETLDPFHLPFLNTLILLLSGSTLTWAHFDMVEGHTKEMMRKTAYTIGLGCLFMVIQGLEYSHASFSLQDGIYPSTFYLATGFHGFHVLVGVIFLMVCWFRARAGHYDENDHFGFEAAAWYWHFVDVIWLFLFISMYCWGAH